MHPDLIPKVDVPVVHGEADPVISSRYMGRNGMGTPTHRRTGQVMPNQATKFGIFVNVIDFQSGYHALSLDALNNTNLCCENLNIESEMIAYFAELGLRIMEVPVTVRYDVPNRHKEKPLNHGLSVLGGI